MATISGAVTSRDGGPIAGAHVLAYGDDEQADPVFTVADEDGRYVFTDLGAGRYRIVAGADEHEPGWWGDPDPGARVAVADDGRRDDVDIVLTAGGAEVRGTVRDRRGAPIADAAIRVHASGGPSHRYDHRGDANGSFVMWLPIGEILVWVTATGYVGGFEMTGVPTRRLDFVLQREAVIAGIVVDANSHAPVAGATVWCGAIHGDGGSTALERAVTDDRGRFRIGELLPGLYKPNAEGPRHRGAVRDSLLVGLGESLEGVVIPIHEAFSISGRVVVVGDPVPRFEGMAHVHNGLHPGHGQLDPDGRFTIGGVPPGRYRAFVTSNYAEDPCPNVVVVDRDITGLEWTARVGGTITGTCRDHDGAPLRFQSIAAHSRDRGSRSGTTDTTGAFVIRDVRPGPYEVYPRSLELCSPVPHVAVEVRSGEETRIDIQCARGGVLAGVVVDDRGARVANASLQLKSPGYDRRTRPGEDRTADDGTFRIAGLPAGTYQIVVHRGLRSAEESASTAVVVAGETSSIRIVVESASESIAGVVVDASGAPVDGACVDAYHEDAEGSARGVREASWYRHPAVTTADGSFVLGDLRAGRHSVRAYRDGRDDVIAVHVAAGTSDLRLVLEPYGSISGTVIRTDGSISDDLAIIVTADDIGFQRREMFYRTGGAFTLRGLPRGTFSLVARTPSGRLTTTVELAAGEHRTDVVIGP